MNTWIKLDDLQGFALDFLLVFEFINTSISKEKVIDQQPVSAYVPPIYHKLSTEFKKTISKEVEKEKMRDHSNFHQLSWDEVVHHSVAELKNCLYLTFSLFLSAFSFKLLNKTFQTL